MAAMSLVEIAKRAGVSKSTVSRVINEKPGVREDVRKAVLEAMQAVGYQPSARRPGPKPLSRKGIKTGNALFLVMGYSTQQLYRMPVFPSVLQGVETALRDAGMNLLIAAYQPEEALPTALQPGQIDGVLILGDQKLTTPALQSQLAGCPAVSLFRPFEAVRGHTDVVTYNNHAVGPLAADYLLSHDHRHTAFLVSEPDHVAFSERLEGFTRIVEAAGGSVLKLIPRRNARAMNETEVISDLIEQLAGAGPDRPTALCAASDVVLPTVYRALAEKGIQPGQDLAIISCDNEEQLIGQLSPRPVEIDIRPELIGREAVRQLLWRMANREEASYMTIMIEPAIIDR